MMIRLNWKEFVQAACERLAQLNPSFTLSDPSFRTDHGSYDGGIGDSYDLPHFVDFDVTGTKPFKCGSGEMGTLYWSKDADLDKLPEMRPAPIDPEVDRIDFYIKSSSGEYIPWKPTEGQLQMISAMGLPTLLAGTGETNLQSPPETGSSSTVATDKPL